MSPVVPSVERPYSRVALSEEVAGPPRGFDMKRESIAAVLMLEDVESEARKPVNAAAKCLYIHR
jgi:hypothetical protein